MEVELEDAEVKCFICGSWVSVRPTKSGKPHAFCSACGLELFFRKQECINALVIGLKEKKTNFVRRRATP